jgi:hypothetical protein
MLPAERELRRAVAEGRGLPHSGRVARFTLVIQQTRDVIGTLCIVEISLMTGETCARQSCELAVGMTIGTLYRAMRSGQCELRVVMREG